MIISLGLALLVTISGTLATYFYEQGVSLPARICAGSCLGLAGLGLIGFAVACLAGLTPLTLVLTTVLVMAPVAILLKKDVREELAWDISNTVTTLEQAIRRPTWSGVGYLSFY